MTGFVIFFSIAIAFVSVGTQATIQQEGLACFAMASSIPGLRILIEFVMLFHVGVDVDKYIDI
jgi:hypothetical protein